MQGKSYFQRRPHAIDGRAFNERTRQAVLRTASNVGTYRGLVEALAHAKDGTLITVTEKITVPETLLIKKNRITITTEGRGAFIPASSGLTLFRLEEVNETHLEGVRVEKSKDNEIFETFISHNFHSGAYPSLANWKPNIENIYITNCRVEADTFLNLNITGHNPVGLFPTEVTTYVGYRSFILNNIHIPTDQTGFFIDSKVMLFTTISGNETGGSIKVKNATGNLINDNFIGGKHTSTIDLFLPFTGVPVNPGDWSVALGEVVHDQGMNTVTGNMLAYPAGSSMTMFFDPTLVAGPGYGKWVNLFYNNLIMDW